MRQLNSNSWFAAATRSRSWPSSHSNPKGNSELRRGFGAPFRGMSLALEAVPHTGAMCTQHNCLEFNHCIKKSLSLSRKRSKTKIEARVPGFRILSKAIEFNMPNSLATEVKTAGQCELHSSLCETLHSLCFGPHLVNAGAPEAGELRHFGSAQMRKPLLHLPPGFTPLALHPATVLKAKQMGSPAAFL